MLQDGVGQLASHHSRHEVQVIVMGKHEGPLSPPSGFAHNLLGKEFVDQAIALGPGSVRTVVEHRRFRQVPEVMLHEPEEWIGDGVVVKVVRQPRRIDPADLESRAVGGLDHHRFAAASQLEFALEPVAHRRHPHRARGLGESRESRHESAGTSDEAVPIAGVRRKVDRRTVGGDNGVEVLEEAPGVLLDRQHWFRSNSTRRRPGRRRPAAELARANNN